MIEKRTLDTARYFFAAYPKRTAALVLLLLLSGVAEGVGLVTLVPLLEVGAADGTPASGLGSVVVAVLSQVGIPATFVAMLILIVLGMLAKAAFLWLAARHVGYTVAQVATDLRLSLIRSLMGARWSYFASQSAGHLANAIGAEALRASQTYRATVSVVAGAIQVVLYFGVAVLVSWRVALLGLAAGALFVVALSKFVDISRRAGDQQTLLTRSLAARLIDALRGIKPIKAMARERYIWPLLESETEELNEANRRQVLAGESLRLAQEPLMVVFIAFGLWVALQAGNTPLPSILVLAFLFYRLTGRVHFVQGEYQTISHGESAFMALRESARVAEANREPAMEGGLSATLDRAIELNDVTFGYETDRPVLKGVHMTIPAGSLVAITGPSGVGKSTLLDLIIGLHQPWGGTVRVDGTDLGRIDPDSWHRMIGYVPQDTFLFHDTIMRNIALGDDSISREAVQRSLREAGAWQFVEEESDGVDSIVGEAGSMLSGGQRQRVALARALVTNPKLLILDEATSALDPATERAICASLERLRGERTILAISHQPAIVDSADIVYRMEAGRLVEDRNNWRRLREPEQPVRAVNE